MMLEYLKVTNPGFAEAGLPQATIAHKHGWTNEIDGLIHTMSDSAVILARWIRAGIFAHTQEQFLRPSQQTSPGFPNPFIMPITPTTRLTGSIIETMSLKE